VQVPEPHEELDPEKFTVEDFMIPDLMKPGLGQICSYCSISKGWSIFFKSIDHYAVHWFDCHREQGYSIYATAADLERCQKEQRAKYKNWLRNHFKRNTRIAAMVVPNTEKKKHKIKTRVSDMRELTPEERVTI
jgi:hypothetical protein